MDLGVVVNGRSHSLAGTGAHCSLLTWLRGLGLTGAKEGCAEGECGACAVLVNRPDGAERSRWTGINACLVPAAGLDGQEVLTAEGLGSPDVLHPVQRELATRGGSQCGYCTPGFVCAMAAEYYRPDRVATAAGNGSAPLDSAERGANGFDLHALSGNLCRCTGYRPIRDAAFALSAPDADDPLNARSQQPAAPPRPTRLGGPVDRYVRPSRLADALDLLAERPDAHVVAGSTDWGVELNLRHDRPTLVIGLDRLEELRGYEVTDSQIRLGAALTLSEAERALAGRVPLLDELFPQFASRLIRNSATFGGNLATASPIGDGAPALLALDAEVVLVSAAGERVVALAEFFSGYRQTLRRDDELISAVCIPRPLATTTGFHKIAKRRFDDISSVAVAFAVDIAHGRVRSARIGLGGVAATPLRGYEAEQALLDQPWTRRTVAAASDILGGLGTPIDDHRASARYRAAMLRTALLSFYAAHPGADQ